MVCLWVIWDGWAAFFLWLTHWSTMSNTAILVDFSNMYRVGKWWVSGAYMYPGTHIFTYPFAYPPSSLLLFGFLAQFDFGTAALLWTRLGLLMFLIALLGATAVLRSDRKYLFVSIAALLFFTSYGVRIELQLGQVSLLLAGLVVLSLVAHRLRHSRTSATLLAMGTLLTGASVLFLLYFVVFYRDLRYLLYFLESTVVILGVSVLVVPIQLYWIWVVKVFPRLLASAVSPMNGSAMGLISLPGLSYLIPGVLAAGIFMFAVFAYVVYPKSLTKLGSPSSVAADAMFLMNSLVMLLLLTRCWPQDYVWVILPVALLVSELVAEGVKTTYFIVVGLAAFLFNLDVYPLLSYFYYYYYNLQIAIINYEYYFPILATIPTGLIGMLLMVPALIVLFIRPQAILRNRPNSRFLLNCLARK
jgi:hypothetical protein